MFERVRRDLERYFAFESRTESPTLADKARVLVTNHALKGVLVYRLGSWIERTQPPTPVRIPLKMAYRALDEAVTALFGMHIHSTADIDGGLYCSHPHGILIGSAKMGADCNIGHGVTIGMRPGGTEEDTMPTLGDRVFVGPGSVVFGGITIADGAAIGPLTVVGRNLPPRCLAVGNPMQIVKKDYENRTLIYGNKPLPPASGGDR
jgi:serine O-acetyltransferase